MLMFLKGLVIALSPLGLIGIYALMEDAFRQILKAKQTQELKERCRIRNEE